MRDRRRSCHSAECRENIAFKGPWAREPCPPKSRLCARHAHTVRRCKCHSSPLHTPPLGTGIVVHENLCPARPAGQPRTQKLSPVGVGLLPRGRCWSPGPHVAGRCRICGRWKARSRTGCLQRASGWVSPWQPGRSEPGWVRAGHFGCCSNSEVSTGTREKLVLTSKAGVMGEPDCGRKAEGWSVERGDAQMLFLL